MKLYTKTGDKGSTSLASGTRISKTALRIEAYGTVDELTSYVGLLRDISDDKQIKEVLLEVLDRLMTVGGILSFETIDHGYKIPQIVSSDLSYLEGKIDQLTAEVPVMRSFVLPGGTILSSHCQVARTICRRAERAVLRLNEESKVPDLCTQYLNRLSDFLFILARKCVKDANAAEIPWIPRVD